MPRSAARRRPGCAAAIAVAAAALATGAQEAPADALPRLDSDPPRSIVGPPGLGGVEMPAPAADDWIVELDAPPLAAFEGGGRPERATAPRATGRKLDVGSDEARAWRAELDRRERDVIARAGIEVRPTQRYRTVLTGFAARLSIEEVAALRRTPGVRRVTRERFLRPLQQQSPSPAGGGLAGSEAKFLGLPDGLWKRLGGPRQAGRGVIVGVVDSGITPDAESFAQRDLEPPPVWNGACESGEEFPVTSCNGKLIGARYFVDGLGAENLPEGTFLSPRDEVGHGTHVAATAAGNDRVDPVIAGNDLNVGRITGVAPAAHVAAYKACWAYACSVVDVIAAVDASVADGVDVVNMSLGFSLPPGEIRPLHEPGQVDALQLALLNADAAGVFVAVSAGNSGEAPFAIASPAAAPWTTATAATSSPRTFRTTVRARGVGGTTVEATASSAGPGVEAEIVDAATFDEGGEGEPVSEDSPRFCIEGMTPERVAGKVVLCDAYDFPHMNLALKRAGAAGFLLAVGERTEDPASNAMLPGAFLATADMDRLRRLAAAGPASVTVPPARAAQWLPDRVAGFSSRGPTVIVSGPGFAAADLVKPDLAAPGVNVLSAFAPRTYDSFLGEGPQERFAALSGTSMASPHVAGVGALLTQLHPTWSSAQLRSALVTTGRPVIDSDGQGAAPVMAAGGGRIDPGAAADPSLVLAPTTEEYERYAEAIDPEAIPGDPDPIAPRDLNGPHLALATALTPITVTRTVESVASTRTSWAARAETADFDLRVEPSRFTIAPGQRQKLTFLVSTPEGPRTFRDGAVVLRDQRSGRQVRIPITVRNPIVDAPPRIEIHDAPPDGVKEVPTTVGGTTSAVAHGLARPRTHQVDAQTPFGPFFEGVLPIDIPEGTALLSARTPQDEETFALVIAVIVDVDGDGRLSPGDRPASAFEWQSTDNASRADGVLPEPGKYLLIIESERPGPVPVTTWTVADPRPDDPEPAPGLVADGDPFHAYPQPRQPLALRWNGADGDAPLRGVVLWHRGAQPTGESVIDASVVDVTPARG
jgi:subtilisin family serine protease